MQDAEVVTQPPKSAKPSQSDGGWTSVGRRSFRFEVTWTSLALGLNLSAIHARKIGERTGRGVFISSFRSDCERPVPIETGEVRCGDLLVAINGGAVDAWPLDAVCDALRSAPRPVTLVFERGRGALAQGICTFDDILRDPRKTPFFLRYLQKPSQRTNERARYSGEEQERVRTASAPSTSHSPRACKHMALHTLAEAELSFLMEMQQLKRSARVMDVASSNAGSTRECGQGDSCVVDLERARRVAIKYLLPGPGFDLSPIVSSFASAVVREAVGIGTTGWGDGRDWNFDGIVSNELGGDKAHGSLLDDSVQVATQHAKKSIASAAQAASPSGSCERTVSATIFDNAARDVRQHLYSCFEGFVGSEHHAKMLATLCNAKPVVDISLDQVLQSHRYCSHFLLYLMQSRRHIPLLLWLSMQRDLLPRLREADDVTSRGTTDWCATAIFRRHLSLSAPMKLQGLAADTLRMVRHAFGECSDNAMIVESPKHPGSTAQSTDVETLDERVTQLLKVQHEALLMLQLALYPAFVQNGGTLHDLLCSAVAAEEGKRVVSPESDESHGSPAAFHLLLRSVRLPRGMAIHRPLHQHPKHEKWNTNTLKDGAADLPSCAWDWAVVCESRNGCDSTRLQRVHTVPANTGLNDLPQPPPHLEQFCMPFDPAHTDIAGVERLFTFVLSSGGSQPEWHCACLLLGHANVAESATKDDTQVQMRFSALVLVSRHANTSTLRTLLATFYEAQYSVLAAAEHPISHALQDWDALRICDCLCGQGVCDTKETGSLMEVLFTALSPAQVLTLLSAALLEIPLIFVSSNISTLTSAAEATRTMISPLRWLHIYAPLLPFSLLSHLACPTPYIVGVHASYASEALLSARSAQSNFCVVDLDVGDIERCGAVPLLPDVPRSLAATSLLHELHPELAHSDHIGTSKQAQRAHVGKPERLQRAAQVIQQVVNVVLSGTADHCVRLMDWTSHQTAEDASKALGRAPPTQASQMTENEVMILDEPAFIASRMDAFSQLRRSDLTCRRGSEAEPPEHALCSPATAQHGSYPKHDSGCDEFMTLFVSTQHFSAHIVGASDVQLQQGERLSIPVY